MKFEEKTFGTVNFYFWLTSVIADLEIEFEYDLSKMSSIDL